METYPIPGFSEPVSSLTHLLSAGVFAVPGFFLLRKGRGSASRMFALGVFVFTCIFLLSMSGVYHLLEAGGAGHRVLQRLDHAAIFALIAGSFTPIHWVLFRGWARWGVLALIWSLAITGLTLKVIFFDSIPEWLGLSFFLGLGWIGLASGIVLWRRYGFSLVRPLVYSGLCYTAGGVLEFLRTPVLIPGVLGPHELLHIAVLAGIGFHFRFLFGMLDRIGSDGVIRLPSHREEHFRGGDTVKDVVLGMADGLTVPFALAAGITGAIGVSRVIVTAGVAEIAAGAVAMGLGGYLAARSEAEHYASEQRREEREIVEQPLDECREIADLFREYGLGEAETAPLLEALRKRPEAWRDFMMRFELGLEAPDPRRALRSAVNIAAAYVVGGAIPLAPYVLLDDAGAALRISAAATLLALFVFGFVKGHYTGIGKLKSGLQTVGVGGIAALVAYALARWVG
jgi:channel protein (hemolysin III family)